MIIHFLSNAYAMNKDLVIERMQSRVQQSCKFIGTKESVYKRKELNYHRIGLVH